MDHGLQSGLVARRAWSAGGLRKTSPDGADSRAGSRRSTSQPSRAGSEVILDEPDALRQLHRDFPRAGCDVMVALTYYAHRDKLRDVGRGDHLEQT
jgi:S-methylmethionine-dependent homocysteine/selenocysteine methylase